MIRCFAVSLALGAFFSPLLQAQSDRSTFAPDNPSVQLLASEPWEFGAVTQDGFGVTENRNSFRFAALGLHVGKVLTRPIGPRPIRGDFEYAIELYPFWQSYTPTFNRANCVATPGAPNGVSCSASFQVGGTFTGMTITPILLRWNFEANSRVSWWAQGGGGVLWTNHKYPAFGGAPYNLQNDGPNADASVWNFTPQGGVGLHYFLKPRHSIDFGANAIHISSASLGDRNPGVNASVQFTLGYTWWK